MVALDPLDSQSSTTSSSIGHPNGDPQSTTPTSLLFPYTPPISLSPMTTATTPSAIVPSSDATGSFSQSTTRTAAPATANIFNSTTSNSMASSTTAPSTINSSTLGPSLPTSAIVTASSNVASSGAASSSSIANVSSSSNTGLIAGIGVLAGLLAIALATIAYLLLRKRTRASDRGTYTPAYDEPQKNFAKAEELPADPPDQIGRLENTIDGLETQLHERDNQLRAAQTALLQHNRGFGTSILEDQVVRDRFSRLNDSVEMWVETYFDDMPAGGPSDLSRDTKVLLQSGVPEYATLLKDSELRLFVIRSLVAALLTQAFTTSELIGSPAFSELSSAVTGKASTNEAVDWRVQTMSLLERSPDYHSERTSSGQEVSRNIDYHASDAAGLEQANPARFRSLNQIVESAAALAMDLAKQRANFKFSMERGSGVAMFNAVSMRDVSGAGGLAGGETARRKEDVGVNGRVVRCTVWPAMRKFGDGKGSGYERESVVSKALVLL
ncbi:hypothetical protein MMC25_004858 [Agyrium rufum]|nr:hypothetical protein [Agyrium rufum]